MMVDTLGRELEARTSPLVKWSAQSTRESMNDVAWVRTHGAIGTRGRWQVEVGDGRYGAGLGSTR